MEKLRQDRDDFYQSNLDDYRVEDEAIAGAIDVLVRFNETMQYQRVSELEEHISTDFVLRYGYIRDDEIVYEIQERDSFIARRSGWVEKSEPAQVVQTSIKDVRRGDPDTLEILAALTLRSTHFAPRFSARYQFEKTGGKWRISELVLVQSLPGYPALYEIDIGFAAFREDHSYYPGNLAEIILAEGPEYPFEEVFDLKKSVRSRSEHAPLVIVFREPPPEGAILWIVEDQIGRNNVIRTRVEVDRDGTPYYWLTGIGWEGGPYKVRVSVLMEQDGETVTLARDVLSLL